MFKGVWTTIPCMSAACLSHYEAASSTVDEVLLFAKDNYLSWVAST